MELHEADKLLVALLRKAGDEWGALGVARVAAQLAGHDVVPVPEPPPVPITVRHEDWRDSWPEQRADGKPDGWAPWPVRLARRVGDVHIDTVIAVLFWLMVIAWVAVAVLAVAIL